MPTGDGEQGFVHAKHALYQLNHTPLAYSLSNFRREHTREICPCSVPSRRLYLRLIKIKRICFLQLLLACPASLQTV